MKQDPLPQPLTQKHNKQPPASPPIVLVSSHTTTTSPATTPAARERSRESTPDTPLGSTPISSPSPPAPAQSEEALYHSIYSSLGVSCSASRQGRSNSKRKRSPLATICSRSAQPPQDLPQRCQFSQQHQPPRPIPLLNARPQTHLRKGRAKLQQAGVLAETFPPAQKRRQSRDLPKDRGDTTSSVLIVMTTAV
ncbi:hypothetical protein GQ457_09G022350 [Hibiscus cannabinus]